MTLAPLPRSERRDIIGGDDRDSVADELSKIVYLPAPLGPRTPRAEAPRDHLDEMLAFAIKAYKLATTTRIFLDGRADRRVNFAIVDGEFRFEMRAGDRALIVQRGILEDCRQLVVRVDRCLQSHRHEHHVARTASFCKPGGALTEVPQRPKSATTIGQRILTWIGVRRYRNERFRKARSIICNQPVAKPVTEYRWWLLVRSLQDLAAAIDRLNPICWGNTLVGQPILDVKVGGAVPALVRRWQGISPDIDQSSLNEHYLSIHLGGVKRLHRDGEGQNLVRDTAPKSHSFVPAGSAYKWTTEGPVDFAHLYFDPKTIDRFVASSFDRDPRGAALRACLGESDQLIDALAAAVLAELSNGDGLQQAYLDDLMHLLLFQLLRCYSDAGSVAALNPHALAPHRLRIAIDFIESHLSQPIGVSDIAAAAGMSTFHFSRAFRLSTGAPPYAYLLDRRIAAAKLKLLAPGGSLTAIALECGFSSANQFSRMFKNATGLNPSCYRNSH